MGDGRVAVEAVVSDVAFGAVDWVCGYGGGWRGDAWRVSGGCSSSEVGHTQHHVVALALLLLCSFTGGAIVQAIALRFWLRDPLLR